MQWVIMGVSGAGKSEVGSAVAASLGRPFGEGDSLHPAANIAKMHAGIPLTDDDRWPWLDLVGAWLADHPGGMITCSALRRVYRDRLRTAAPATRFVLLAVAPEVLRARLALRTGHFMPASLLDSQLATLEPFGPGDAGIVVDASTGTIAEVAARVVAAISADAAS